MRSLYTSHPHFDNPPKIEKPQDPLYWAHPTEALQIGNFLAEYSQNPGPVLFNLGVYSKEQVNRLIDTLLVNLGKKLHEYGVDIKLSKIGNEVSITNLNGYSISFKTLTPEYEDILNNFKQKVLELASQNLHNEIDGLLKERLVEFITEMLNQISDALLEKLTEQIKQVLEKEVADQLEKIKEIAKEEAIAAVLAVIDGLVNDKVDTKLGSYIDDFGRIVPKPSTVLTVVNVERPGVYDVVDEDGDRYHILANAIYNELDVVDNNTIINTSVNTNVQNFVDTLAWTIIGSDGSFLEENEIKFSQPEENPEEEQPEEEQPEQTPEDVNPSEPEEEKEANAN